MSKETRRKKQKRFFDEENRRAGLAKHRDPLKRLNQWNKLQLSDFKFDMRFEM